MGDDFEGFEQAAGHGGYWNGTARGGPLDGSAVSVESAAGFPMRGMVFYVCVGEDVGTAAWHAYAYSQSADPQRGVQGHFTHLGLIVGDPPSPEERSDSD